MVLSRLPLFLVPLLLFSFLQSPTFAIKKSYVVYMGGHSHGPELSSLDLDEVRHSHCEFLGSFLGSYKKAEDAIFYSYKRHINGFAATLEEEEAAEIAKNPRVISVFLNEGRKLHTTRSWDFLGLQERDSSISSESIWSKARFGEDTIIGNLDTGVWPESKSFSDDGYGPIPPKWKGFCQQSGTNKDVVRCNRKLIGARYFNKGYASAAGTLLKSSLTLATARDDDGHGTHTLSTAGGNFVPGANVLGFGNGTAKGGAPRARVAAYRVCWPPINGSECYDADILAAFDAAIHDGVDIISVSLGGAPSDYFQDGISIGAFHAVKNGIVVVTSAGNSGPDAGSVSNVSPWLFTVGASTIDREFPVYVKLGNKVQLKGQSLSASSLPAAKYYPLISGAKAKAANASAKDALLCKAGTLDPEKVKGKILACLRGVNGRVQKGIQAALAGAVGMILANDEINGNEIIVDTHVLPAAHIIYKDGLDLFAYINSTKSPIAYITRPVTQMAVKPAPFMASFSSRGPNTITPEILKPDITAPGVSIIAAYTQATGPTGEKSDERRVQFNSESGTSMSCPHVAGISGLLKTLHPDWSPSAIRSAIMTSARTRDNKREPMLNSSYVKANPFDYGAGHVRPNRAMDPGLVYDLTVKDYLNFLCALGYNETKIKSFWEEPYECPNHVRLLDFNYPSITVPRLSGPTTISRTVKNVGTPGTYKARFRPPPGISVSVEPLTLKFDKLGEEKSFKLTLKLKAKKAPAASNYVFGRLIWSDGNHYVRSPIVVKAA
ncbi:PREDICTED: subtilisin-like protease SBT5.4 [Nelumbo nucifera]|uniref:Subtilisin-like protease SBT5.4 n=1 Tax=Nelumbo nucifera TaxID=4432 RepID=A0A1U7ZGV0_NELNU|nr:PREDICTED: subtilisin-like protease SBT5.4 [Nelumbo nucifera]XP_010252986.1 PREDICTED: subtilisin-like protease SBT5.4 [Nelumbo nucifera]